MKEYRQNSHTKSLVFWAILCTATAIVLFAHSHKLVNRLPKIEEILAGIALLIFGPAALTVYLLRARMLWVELDPERGLRISGRRSIAWDEVLAVERKRPAFRKSSGPAEVPEFEAADVLSRSSGGCVDLGCLAGVGELFIAGLIVVAAVFAIWLIFFVFIPLVILPLLEVFAPFGDRIKLVTRRGTFVFHDLSDADEFVSEVARRRPAVER